MRENFLQLGNLECEEDAEVVSHARVEKAKRGMSRML